MLSHVVYGCQCLNIKIHLSTKYSLNDHINERKKTVVQEPEPGWEFELGMGGIIIEYRSLIQTFYGHAGWVTVKCLNCGMGSVYSIKRTENNMENIQDTDRIVIHNNSIFGSEMDSIRKSAGYSKTFNIVLLQDSKNTIPLPESTDGL
ncbi:hypothetical protein BDB01DRAFT_332330 [Pilobolus umbonatus]|nr:hypothetical protein BDB01DRAFT_332330 [Pilobolus umbonatus]